MSERVSARMPGALEALGASLPVTDTAGACKRLADEAVDAFHQMSLLSAARLLLAKARGSFGLVLSHSLDAHSELVVAARGQTMSVAFYPQMGLVLFGSEAATTKVAMGSSIDMGDHASTADMMKTVQIKRSHASTVNG